MENNLKYHWNLLSFFDSVCEVEIRDIFLLNFLLIQGPIATHCRGLLNEVVAWT